MSARDNIFYAIGKRRVSGEVNDGYVKLWTSLDDHFHWGNFKVVGKGYVTPCWWLFRRSIRTMMDKAIIKANRLHSRDQKILFGQNMVVESLENIKLEAEALQLLDKEFTS